MAARILIQQAHLPTFADENTTSVQYREF